MASGQASSSTLSQLLVTSCRLFLMSDLGLHQADAPCSPGRSPAARRVPSSSCTEAWGGVQEMHATNTGMGSKAAGRLKQQECEGCVTHCSRGMITCSCNWCQERVPCSFAQDGVRCPAHTARQAVGAFHSVLLTFHAISTVPPDLTLRHTLQPLLLYVLNGLQHRGEDSAQHVSCSCKDCGQRHHPGIIGPRVAVTATFDLLMDVDIRSRASSELIVLPSSESPQQSRVLLLSSTSVTGVQSVVSAANN